MKSIIVKNILIISLFGLFGCNKETAQTTTATQTFNTLKSAIEGDEKADIYLEFDYNYHSPSKKFINFNNKAFFVSKKTESNVLFNNLIIAKSGDGFANSSFINPNSTTGYKEMSKNAIGTVSTFSVSNSTEVPNFSSEIYIPIPITATFTKTNNLIDISWNVDDKIDNNIFAVILEYEVAGVFYSKSYIFNQNLGQAQINTNDLAGVIPSGTGITILYGRGVYIDKVVNEKKVKTIAYTYSIQNVSY